MNSLNKYLRQFETIKDESGYEFSESVTEILADMNACTNFWDSFDKIVEETEGLIALRFARWCWSFVIVFVFDNVAWNQYSLFEEDMWLLLNGCPRVHKWIGSFEKVGVKDSRGCSYPATLLDSDMLLRGVS